MPTLKYFGHSAFRIQDEKHTVFIDPFITGNPVCPIKSGDVVKCDYILVTHGHADHLGDAVELSLKFKATIVATWELANWCQSKGAKVHPMSTGGAHDFSFGRVKMTIAFHGCGGDPRPDGSLPPPNSPVGFLITWGKTKNIYHAGDTALFSDMKLIGERPKIDMALLPIGDNFTMGVEDAARAMEFLDAQACVPMHYNTFDMIKADPLAFAFRVEKMNRKCHVMKPGDKIEF